MGICIPWYEEDGYHQNSRNLADHQILDKGEMQVSDKEREQLLKNTRKELLLIVASKVVHPDTNRLFPLDTIEKAIEEIGFDVKVNEPAKKQANFLIKELSDRYFLKKADMEIKLTLREEWITSTDGPEGNINEKRLEELKAYLKSHSITVKPSKETGMLVFTCLVEAAQYKDISVDSKNFFPKSVCEITEHFVINKSVSY
jgi:ribosome maturation protein Sdo1